MKATLHALPLVLVFSAALGQEAPDFSGVYLLNSPKDGKSEKASSACYLRVTQIERSVEATFTDGGKKRTVRYFLDGSPSRNLTPGGVPSTDVARQKGKALLIESIIPVGGTVLHTKQKWQLSRNLTILTIHSTCEGTSLGITIDLPSTDKVYSRQESIPAS